MELRSDPGIAPIRDQQFTPGLQSPPAHLSFAPAVTPPVFRSPASVETLDSAGAIVDNRLSASFGDQIKKKRGRPRKYCPDGSVYELGAISHATAGSSGHSLSSPSSALAIVTKKSRGRPPGSGKKQQLAALGSAGVGFTPHVIIVNAGEDVSSKIMSFSQHGPRAVCVLSANGAISTVTLRQAATSGGTVTYEGRFELLSLSGSFLLSESDGQRGRTGGLSVSLAGPDGRLLGGGVAGVLTAASPVQVILGSFIMNEKKEKAQLKASEASSLPEPSGGTSVEQVHAAVPVAVQVPAVPAVQQVNAAMPAAQQVNAGVAVAVAEQGSSGRGELPVLRWP